MDQKFAGMDFQKFSTDYHTWGSPVFFLEAPLQGGPTWILKWEPSAMTIVFIGH